MTRVLGAWWLTTACTTMLEPEPARQVDTEPDADSDSDVDADGDTDADTDSDTDADTDADTDTAIDDGMYEVPLAGGSWSPSAVSQLPGPATGLVGDGPTLWAAVGDQVYANGPDTTGWEPQFPPAPGPIEGLTNAFSEAATLAAIGDTVYYWTGIEGKWVGYWDDAPGPILALTDDYEGGYFYIAVDDQVYQEFILSFAEWEPILEPAPGTITAMTTAFGDPSQIWIAVDSQVYVTTLDDGSWTPVFDVVSPGIAGLAHNTDDQVLRASVVAP